MTNNEETIKAYESEKLALAKRVSKSIKEHPGDWSCDGDPVIQGIPFINRKAGILICHERQGFFKINGMIINSIIEDDYIVPAIYGWATERAKGFIKAIDDSEDNEKAKTLTSNYMSGGIVK